MADQTSAQVPINRLALISAVTGVLCVSMFCGGLAPIPFTDWFCYPATGVLALIALATGIESLVQIRLRQERGRAYAWVGVGVGGVTLVLALCAASLGILIALKLIGLLH